MEDVLHCSLPETDKRQCEKQGEERETGCFAAKSSSLHYKVSFSSLWQIKQYFSTLSCPVEDRETERVPVSPFATFGNAGESDPFTSGGWAGGGDCVMNCEDSAPVIDGRLLYYASNHQDNHIFSECCCVENSKRLRFICFFTCGGDMSPFWLSMSEGESWGTALKGESWLVGWSGERASLLSSSRDELSPPAPFGESVTMRKTFSLKLV